MIRESPAPGRVWKLLSRRVMVLATGLVLVSLILTRAWREVDVRALASEARQLFEARRFNEADRVLEHWLQARPDAAEAHLLRARIAYAQGRFRESRAALERARAVGIGLVSFQRLDALLLARTGQPAEAEEVLVRIVQGSDRPDPEVLEVLARLYLESYRLPLATAVLDRWGKAAPGDPTPFLWMSEIDLRAEQGGPERAVDHYREALRRAPDLDRARLGLAEALRQSHRPETAAREFAAYLARNPDDADAHVGAARAALSLGRQAEAIEHLDRALEVAPAHVEALQERAGIDLALNDPTIALSRLDRANQIDPYHAEVAYRRGLALERLGRSDEAQGERVRSERLRAEQKQLREIQRQFNQDPNNDRLRCEIAQWMLDHGQAEVGVRWLRTVLAHNPGHTQANRLLSEHYARRGDTGLANFYKLQANRDLRR